MYSNHIDRIQLNDFKTCEPLNLLKIANYLYFKCYHTMNMPQIAELVHRKNSEWICLLFVMLSQNVINMRTYRFSNTLMLSETKGKSFFDPKKKKKILFEFSPRPIQLIVLWVKAKSKKWQVIQKNAILCVHRGICFGKHSRTVTVIHIRPSILQPTHPCTPSVLMVAVGCCHTTLQNIEMFHVFSNVWDLSFPLSIPVLLSTCHSLLCISSVIQMKLVLQFS